MGELLSCPFCRELFAQDEGPKCPDCDLPLVPLHQLPLSLEGQAEAATGQVDPPEDQNLPLHYFRRGRGSLPLVALLGMALFTMPWVSLMRPDEIMLSGFDLAVSNAPWLWGGAVGWFLLIPLVLSRRTLNQMYGIRIICTLFALMTAGETTLMLLRPPTEHQYFATGLEYCWGIYASLFVSLIGAFVSVRLGGSMDDLRDLPVDVPTEQARRPGEAVH